MGWDEDDDGWAQRPCRGLGGLFFSDVQQDIDRAKALCGSCPLIRECLSGALERRESCGVWGGNLIRGGLVLHQTPKRGRPPRAA